MTTRRCANWLETLATYVEDTESPRHFWLWSGISTLSLALQRRTWIPFGTDKLYPNLYILVVAKPGRCRKGPPVKFARKILTELDIPVFVDSPTKRAFTKELDRLGRCCHFRIPGDPIAVVQSPLAVISTEMSSLLAVNPKEMIEILTELFDSQDVWRYKTSDKGEDEVYGACVGCLIATTPSWLADNLPAEAIGGGFTSRFVILFAEEKYKHVSLPPLPPPEIYEDLKHDLSIIYSLSGQFEWGPGAFEFYDKWYHTIEPTVKKTSDERIHGYLERIHIIALKTAMALRVSYSDDLTLTPDDLGRATILLKSVLENTSKALGGHGRDPKAHDKERIKNQITTLRITTLPELLRMNYQHLRKDELLSIIEDLSTMGSVRWTGEGRQAQIEWIGGH